MKDRMRHSVVVEPCDRGLRVLCVQCEELCRTDVPTSVEIVLPASVERVADWVQRFMQIHKGKKG